MIINNLEVFPEDMPEEYQDIVEAIGLENMIELIKLRGGEQLYLRKLDDTLRPARDRQLYKEYNGSYRELVRKYNLTENAVREIIKRINIEKFNERATEMVKKQVASS